MRVLVVNSGSTSVKLSLIDTGAADGGERPVAEEALGPPDDGVGGAIDRFRDAHGGADAVGHRIVHGGPDLTSPVVVDDGVRATLDGATDLAPLHNPPALAALDALRRRRPGVPQVACFDTAFHAGLPAPARTYALPPEWVGRWRLRRYGFHGLSCEWSVGRGPRQLGLDPGAARLVICHLGGGASVTATAGGRSVDTTMGFTPVEGLVMATRAGSVDPGLVAWLATHGIGADELADALETRSGLLALAGASDMEDLVERRRSGDGPAGAAVEVWLHRLVGSVAAMAAATDGTDGLVFTGGIGEHAGDLRAEACARLAWMGVGTTVPVAVVTAREDLVVAAACTGLLAPGAHHP